MMEMYKWALLPVGVLAMGIKGKIRKSPKLTKEEEKLLRKVGELVTKKPELKSLIALLNRQAEILQQRFEKIEKKQTEFETRLAKIWMKLLEVQN